MTESPDIATLAAELRGPLLRASRKLRQEALKAGLSAQDALIMGYIHKHPGAGVSELADVDQISRPTMSQHIKRLEAAGWVARSSHADDGRRSGLSVTPAGLKKLETIRRQRNDWLAARLAKLTPDEREALAHATAALSKLANVEP